MIRDEMAAANRQNNPDLENADGNVRDRVANGEVPIDALLRQRGAIPVDAY